MLRSLLGCLIVSAALIGLAPAATAQSGGSEPAIRLVAERTPLAAVLRDLARQAGIDIVFAERAVEGRAVTGRYVGDDVEGALRTVLRGSGLRAEQVRPRQFVVVPETRFGLGVDGPAARGTLEGVVVDGTSGEVLPGAHVVLAGLDLGAATNTAGYFAIPGLPAGDYRVRVSFIGYRATEIELPVYPGSKLEQPVIRLFPQAIQAQAVVIEGSPEERSDLDIPPGSIRMPVRDAGKLPSVLGEGDLFSAFAWLPGIVRSGEVGGELVVRGAEAQYNRYLLDGAPVIHPWHTFGLLSIFQAEALKSARVHKGSFPAEHGGALSAVIDLEMRDGAAGRSSGVVAVSPVSVRGVAEAPLGDRVSLMLTARHSWLDLLLSPRLRLTSNGGLPAFALDSPFVSDAPDNQDIGYRFFDLGGKLTAQLGSGQRLSVSIYDGGDRLRAEAPLSTILTDPVASDTTGLGLAYAWGNRVASARYHGLIGEQFFLTGTAYYSAYHARERSRRLPAPDDLFDTDYRLRFAEIGARVDVDYYHSIEHQLRVGLAVVGRDFASTLVERLQNPGDAVVRRDFVDQVRAVELIGYVQDTWQPASGWQIQPGLRIEYFGLGGYLSINPRVHLRHALMRDRLFVRAGLSRQTQPLHRLRDQNVGSYDLAADRWIPASDRVRPSSAWQIAVGGEWHPRPWLWLEAELFGRILDDILLPRSLTVQPASAGDGPVALMDRVVPGVGRAAGIELSSGVDVGRWRGAISYTFSRTQERAPGEAFRPARYDAPHQIEAYVLGGRGPWSFSAAGTVRSGYPVARNGEIGAGVDRFPTYTRLDLSVGYAFDLIGLEWHAQAQAYNLLNRRYNGDRAPETVAVAEDEAYGLPIIPMVGLQVRW